MTVSGPAGRPHDSASGSELLGPRSKTLQLGDSSTESVRRGFETLEALRKRLSLHLEAPRINTDSKICGILAAAPETTPTHTHALELIDGHQLARCLLVAPSTGHITLDV